MSTRALRIHFCFFFSATATTAIYTLSLHDALPISERQQQQPDPRLVGAGEEGHRRAGGRHREQAEPQHEDRKSTRLNSSHSQISYAVFCLKKKNNHRHEQSARVSNLGVPPVRALSH